MQKIRKILWASSEKTALQTNQLRNQFYQQHRFYRTSLTPVQKNYMGQDIQEWIK